MNEIYKTENAYKTNIENCDIWRKTLYWYFQLQMDLIGEEWVIKTRNTLKECKYSTRMKIFTGLDLPSFFLYIGPNTTFFSKMSKMLKKIYKILPKKESYVQIEWLTSITLLGSFSHTPSLLSCVWYIFAEYDH